MWFVSATGTHIGKTFLSAALARECTDLRVLKPVISGYVAGDETSDTALLLAAQKLPMNDTNVEMVSPFRFARPTSPDMAMAEEEREVTLEEMVAHVKAQAAAHDGSLLVEGAGGVFSPINAAQTNYDLAKALGAKLLLVANTELGQISQTIAILRALENDTLPVAHLIIMESRAADAMKPQAMRESLAAHYPALPAVTLLPYVDSKQAALPSLRHLLA